MNKEEKWDYLVKLDEELLVGGVVLSEWSTILIKDADTAFCANANLASILTSQAAIESHIRFEYHNPARTSGVSFYDLIESSDISVELKSKLHRLRKYRNSWIHVSDPYDDSDLLLHPEHYEEEIEEMAEFSIRVLREVIYSNQFI